MQVKAYEKEVGKDYRLNYRLATNCAKDVGALCANLCSSTDGSVCGGKVLRCLTDKIEDIKAEGCKAEVGEPAVGVPCVILYCWC
jgi:Golgi apparatus protein 1